MQYPGLKNIPAVLTTVRRIKNLVRHESAALIHANTPRTNLMGAMAAKLARIPIIWHERTLLNEGMIDIDRIFSPLADKIICNSEAIRRRFSSTGKFAEKTLAILNGVDLAEFNPGVGGRDIRREFNVNDSTPVVGIISRLWPDKGHRDFIKAAARVLEEIPRVCFVVVGDFESPEYAAHKRELDELISSLGLEGEIIFLGFRSDIPRVMAGLDIVVLPSEVEGCARVLLEAMAMQKPVVATDSGGTPEVVADGRTGILVPPKDPARLADALLRLLSDRELAIKMGRQGRIRVEELFSINKNLAATMAVYEELLGKKL
jgi:glycosyltransferase involved in cell wall biosynthesis